MFEKLGLRLHDAKLVNIDLMDACSISSNENQCLMGDDSVLGQPNIGSRTYIWHAPLAKIYSIQNCIRRRRSKQTKTPEKGNLFSSTCYAPVLSYESLIPSNLKSTATLQKTKSIALGCLALQPFISVSDWQLKLTLYFNFLNLIYEQDFLWMFSQPTPSVQVIQKVYSNVRRKSL